MTERLTYVDNAATTFPKPPDVLGRMIDTYTVTRRDVPPGGS